MYELEGAVNVDLAGVLGNGSLRFLGSVVCGHVAGE